MQIKEYKLDIERNAQMYAYERIYLGVMTVYDHPKYSVYTLGTDSAGGFRVVANVNVAHFNSQKEADSYHDYIENILQHQAWWVGYEAVGAIRKWNSKETQDFYKSILTMRIGIKTLEKQK